MRDVYMNYTVNYLNFCHELSMFILPWLCDPFCFCQLLKSIYPAYCHSLYPLLGQRGGC